MSNKKNDSVVVSVRMPTGLVSSIDDFVKLKSDEGLILTRSGAMVYLLTRGLREQGFKDK